MLKHGGCPKYFKSGRKQVHNHSNCSDEKCCFEIYIASLESVFTEKYDYDAWVNWFIRQSIKHPIAFGAMFMLKKIGKEKVKVYVDKINQFSNIYTC